MGNLTNKYIKDTYDGLIKLADESQGVQPTPQKLQDGVGNDLPAQVSSTEFTITGSLVGNADTATSASHAVQADNADTATTASFALTASHAENYADIYVTGLTFVTESTHPDGGELTIHQTEGQPDITVDLDGRYQTIASAQNENLRLGFIEAATASLEFYTASNGDIRNDFNSYTSSQGVVDTGQNVRLQSLESKTGSYATTGSNIFTGQQTINNDLIIQGDLYVSGSETIISSSTLIVGDREIELNANRTVGNAGIIVYDVVSPEGTGSLQYDVNNNYWIAGQYGSEEKVILQSDLETAAVESAIRTTITAKNVTASPIPKGTPCFITGSGTGGNLVGVIPADASNPSLMPAGVVLAQDLNAGSEGDAVVVGFINGINTGGFNSGDSLYTAVGGGYTNVKPTGSNLIQKIGNVEKVDGSNGSVVVTGPGRSNDVPNIPEGYIWVGNSDQVATPTSTGSFAKRNEVNTFTENQNIQGSLSVVGTSSNPLSVSEQTGLSGSIGFNLNDFGGGSQPTIFFSGDNSYIQADGNFSFENSPGGAGTGSLNFTTNGFLGFTTNGTGSENISFNAATGPINMSSSNFTLTNTTLNAKVQKPASGQENLIDINGQVGYYSGYPAMSQVNLGLQSTGQQYNGFVFELYDSPSYNWGTDLAISANGVYAEVIGSGSGTVGEMNVYANTVGMTYSKIRAQYIDIGNDSTTQDIDLGYVGPNTQTTKLSGNDIKIGSQYGYTDNVKIDTNNIITLDSAQVDITGSVNVVNDISVAGALNAQTTLNVTGVTTLNNNLEVTGSINITDGINIANNGLTVTGNSTFNNNVDITGSLNLTQGIVAQGYNEINATGQFYSNGHFEASGFSKFNNNLQVTGSLGVSGSFNLVQAKPAAGQVNLIDIENQVGFYTGYPAMSQTNVSFQSINGQYNGIVTEMYDSPSYNWGADFSVSPNGVYSELIGSGSGATAEFNIYATSIGSTYGTIKAQNIDIGTNSTCATLDLGYIGPTSLVTKLAGNQVYVGSNFGYTDDIYIDSNNELRLDGTDINITGSVNIQDTMTLAPQDPLPAGASGELAVSSSNELYFHNGTSWNLIA